MDAIQELSEVMREIVTNYTETHDKPMEDGDKFICQGDGFFVIVSFENGNLDFHFTEDAPVMLHKKLNLYGEI